MTRVHPDDEVGAQWLSPSGMLSGMDEERFELAFAAAYRLPALLLGITPLTTHVLLDAHRLHARFGPWSLTTPWGTSPESRSRVGSPGTGQRDLRTCH